MEHKKKFLLDSSVIIAYFNPIDSCHKKAVQTIKDIVNQKGTLFIHVLTFIECIQILKMRAGIEILTLFQTAVIDQATITVVREMKLPSKNSLSFTLFNAQNNLSFVDTTQIEFALAQNIPLITFDKELEKIYKKYAS